MEELTIEPFDSIAVVYASHKEAPLDVIGRLSQAREEVYRLRRLVKGLVVLSTCNRFEVYLDGATPSAVEEVAEIFRRYGVEPGIAWGREAVERILRIASGLESRIIGEPEILGQVRRAWSNAREKGYTSPLLDSIFHQAVVTGKKVRAQTGISRGHASYASAAVHLVAKKLGGLDGKRVVVVGAGDAGLGVLRILCSMHRPGEVVVYTRDPGRARGSVDAACPGADVRERSRLGGDRGFDAAFIAVDDPDTLSVESDIARIVVDLSVPPALRGVNVYGLTDLEEEIKGVIEERRKWMGEALEIIRGDLARLEERVRQRNVSRILKLLVEYADHLARVESGKVNGCRDPYLVLSSFSKKLLHPLMVSLRQTASQAWRLDEFIRVLEESYSRRIRGDVGDGHN